MGKSSCILITAALSVALGLCLVLLPSQACAQDGDQSQLRMEVDPTVLPPVLAPDMEEQTEAEPAADVVAVPADETVAAPDESVVTPLADATPSKEPAAPGAEVVPAEAPAVAPEPTPAPKPSLPTAGVISKIDVVTQGNSFVITVHTDSTPGEPKWFDLDEPARLVFDIPGRWHAKTGNVFRSDSGLVNHLVVGEHPDKLRLVVHLSQMPSGPVKTEFVREDSVLTIKCVF